MNACVTRFSHGCRINNTHCTSSPSALNLKSYLTKSTRATEAVTVQVNNIWYVCTSKMAATKKTWILILHKFPSLSCQIFHTVTKDNNSVCPEIEKLIQILSVTYFQFSSCFRTPLITYQIKGFVLSGCTFNA